jgi:heme O synthase-like polyprenyltransferase
MTGLPPLLTIFLIAAFCVGVGVFYSVATRRSTTAALIGWGICGAAVMALGWGAYAVQAGSHTVIFTGLILPVWLIGGLVGLIVGLALRALRK